ncbi:hypothetical protein FJT64_023061 [Amphibalanus amphitrite]|uniref:Apple domain-containing protein n=1 Tax=Amphibalanus amphitrite TaxID=1232801 RepID=A0A6A4WNI5_AMPAM|nr:hypothetical protein FJT64_023061 [Amphibalanus amphitrite]
MFPGSVLLPLLLSSLAVSGSLYVSHSVQHASRPLKTGGTASLTQCALWCRLTRGCIKWSRDSVTGLCRLWPLHSDSNPLTAAAEPLHQPLLPEGFVLSDDPSIAYRERYVPMVGGNASILASCRAYDPESVPAFPHTERQFNYLKTHITGYYYWIGIWYRPEEGVFADMTTGRTVDLPAELWWNGWVVASASYRCLTLYSAGPWAVGCGSVREGHTCQYSVPVGAAESPATN